MCVMKFINRGHAVLVVRLAHVCASNTCRAPRESTNCTQSRARALARARVVIIYWQREREIGPDVGWFGCVFFSGPLEMRGPSTRRAAYENLSLAGDSHCNAFQFVRFHHTSSPCTPCFAIEPTHTHTRRHWPRQYGQVIHLDVVAVTARRRTPLYGLSLSLSIYRSGVCVF